MEDSYFSNEEKLIVLRQSRSLMRYTHGLLSHEDIAAIRSIITEGIKENHYRRDKYGLNPTVRNINTALLLCDNVGVDRSMIIAILLYNLCKSEFIPAEKVCALFGEDTYKLIHGLLKISNLYRHEASVQDENFRNLLLTFAEDIRVIIIMIIDRLGVMRMINHHSNEKFVHDISWEALSLYVPFAHRLGLYAVKSELEDLWLKYTNRDIYTSIASKLNESKKRRDAYISDFIDPLKARLSEYGLKFDIKGRTKSIYSIWNKIKKQNTDMDHIYDLFAIRIILDTPIEKEKAECWIAYSIVVDMYKSNPARMKDWLSIPKSNGYESLHTTVYGPDKRWVEVQIRSRRMDEIAERGLAAHWKYKGVKSEKNLDDWMNNVRDMLEAAESGPMDMMRDMKMDIYNKEVFVFTPKGDLYRLPLGATLLDFAFQVHSKLGCQCVGGTVDGKNQKINYKLKSGDTIEILTSNSQTPKLDWLNFVITSKARNKIKQTVNEIANKRAEIGKEMLQRRFKNRKIDIDEAVLMKAIKKSGYKTSTDFFRAIADEKLEINDFLDLYIAVDEKDNQNQLPPPTAEGFVLQTSTVTDEEQDDDVLVIGEDIKGINYKLAKCCNPIFGDAILGFVSKEGVIKIHRNDCANVIHLREKYPHRKIDTRWSGKLGSQFAVTLRIVGKDDIGIVTNITSIISKEKKASLRNISIDSHDGLFQGYLVIGINDKQTLNELINKIKSIKGVKNVERSNN